MFEDANRSGVGLLNLLLSLSAAPIAENESEEIAEKECDTANA